jgi:hypothetical protein
MLMLLLCGLNSHFHAVRPGLPFLINFIDQMKFLTISCFCLVFAATFRAQDITDFIPARLFRDNKVKVMIRYTYHTTDSTEKYW